MHSRAATERRTASWLTPRAYIIRRLLLVVPTLFILSVLVFLSVRFIPGDVIDIMASRMLDTGCEVDRELVERRLGLDLPIHVQYGRWIGGILLRGTLGESLLGGWGSRSGCWDGCRSPPSSGCWPSSSA